MSSIPARRTIPAAEPTLARLVDASTRLAVATALAGAHQSGGGAHDDPASDRQLQVLLRELDHLASQVRRAIPSLAIDDARCVDALDRAASDLGMLVDVARRHDARSSLDDVTAAIETLAVALLRTESTLGTTRLIGRATENTSSRAA